MKRDVAVMMIADPEATLAAIAGDGATVYPPFATETSENAKEALLAALDKEAPHVGDFLNDALELMRARATGQAKPIPLPWADVSNRLGGGLWPGLHVLTGATGRGKTQFALQVAWRAANAGVPVLYVGLELDRMGVTARLLALAEGEATKQTPKWSDLYLGKTKQDEFERLVTKHTRTLKELPFRAEFGPPHGWDFRQLAARVCAMREEYPESRPGEFPMLVVLDYLQAVGSPEGERFDIRERISRAAYAGRAVARDFGAAVLLLSSVSRENAKKARAGGNDGIDPEKDDASELVGMGKESGDIEYAADSVLSLVSGDFDERDKVTSMFLAIAKVRAGRTGWCRLGFDGACFTEVQQSAGFVVREERKGQ
jgi:replicative DNA helicase